MSAFEELVVLEQEIFRLRRRIAQQSMHIEGLGDYPDIAKKASAILVNETEDLRRALIQLQELKAQVDKGAARPDRDSNPKKSDAA